MSIEELVANEFVEIVDISKIRQGDMLWQNGDVVQIKEVDLFENRIEVWDKDKFLSELIYEGEFEGIRKLG